MDIPIIEGAWILKSMEKIIDEHQKESGGEKRALGNATRCEHPLCVLAHVQHRNPICQENLNPLDKVGLHHLLSEADGVVAVARSVRRLARFPQHDDFCHPPSMRKVTDRERG